MRALRVVAVIALVGIGAVIGYLSALGNVSEAAGGLTAQDDADIQQLYWRYNHGADFGDADLYASVFTDDAVLRSSDGRSISAGTRSLGSSRGVWQGGLATPAGVTGTTVGASRRQPRGRGAAPTGCSSV